MADEENKDEEIEQSEFTPPPPETPDTQSQKKTGSIWSNHKRGWIMTMGMGGLIFISVIVWILTKP